jgi:hypothetical protein
MRSAAVKVTEGDVRCLAAGHVARAAMNGLRSEWRDGSPIAQRLGIAERAIRERAAASRVEELVAEALGIGVRTSRGAPVHDLFGEPRVTAV